MEVVKFGMDQLGLKQKDPSEIIGLKSRVRAILNQKMKLSLDMIRKLSPSLPISTDVLIQ